jgi:hypothetical protein
MRLVVIAAVEGYLRPITRAVPVHNLLNVEEIPGGKGMWGFRRSCALARAASNALGRFFSTGFLFTGGAFRPAFLACFLNFRVQFRPD